LSQSSPSVPTLQGKRLLVAEEGLKSEVGHFFEYDRAVLEAHQLFGATTVIAAHAEVSTGIKASCGAVPVFQATNWDGIYNYPSSLRRQFGIILHNWRVWRDLNAHLRQSRPYDCVFAPTVTIYHLAGLRLLAATGLGRQFDRLVLLFRNSIGTYHGDGAPTQSGFKRAIWTWLLASFSKHIAAGRIGLTTDSARLADEYRLLTGAELKVLPHPNFTVRQTRSTPLSPDRPYVFGVLGPARFEKGIDLFQSAIHRFQTLRPEARARFVIQWNMPIYMEDGSELRPDPTLIGNPNVDLIDRPMTSAEYGEALTGLDCMVLPYRREAYAARISGVAVEALTAGIPVIYTANTWVADLVSDYGAGLEVPDGDIDALASAMAQSWDQRIELDELARSRAGSARDAQSPESFVTGLWGLT
jgi:glycosyltransferase involved in cell wall biosynthesis